MNMKRWIICLICVPLAGLLYYLYLLAITPAVNGMVEEATSVIDRISEQATTSNTDTTTSNTDNKSSN